MRLTEHLEKLSEHGIPLEVLDATEDFEHFRGWLVEGLGYGDGHTGGRPPFDLVSMLKALILQAQHNLLDVKMEFMICDRLSWMRFLGFDLGGPTPNENTIRLFRNKLTETGTLNSEDRWQDPLPPGWLTVAADRPAGVRSQASHRQRPALRLHPDERCHFGGRSRWRSVPAAGRDGRYLVEGMGRYRLPFESQRRVAGVPDADQLHSSPQPARKANI